jgi:hypothetical protein
VPDMGSTWVRSWLGLGTMLVRPWPNVGSICVRSGSDLGPIWVRWVLANFCHFIISSCFCLLILFWINLGPTQGSPLAPHGMTLGPTQGSPLGSAWPGVGLDLGSAWDGHKPSTKNLVQSRQLYAVKTCLLNTAVNIQHIASALLGGHGQNTLASACELHGFALACQYVQLAFYCGQTIRLGTECQVLDNHPWVGYSDNMLNVCQRSCIASYMFAPRRRRICAYLVWQSNRQDGFQDN